MAANPQIRFDDIGQSTPQFKPPKNINRIDRDNVEITPMGLKTRPEEDEGDKSLELESPLWEKLFYAQREPTTTLL